MNSTRLRSIPIPRRCSLRSPFLTLKWRKGVSASFSQETFLVPLIFRQDVVSIRAVQWRSRFAAKWSQPLRKRRAATTMRPAISPKKSLHYSYADFCGTRHEGYLALPNTPRAVFHKSQHSYSIDKETRTSYAI